MKPVAADKPLSLRRQRSASQSRRFETVNTSFKQAEVFVDNGLFHLDGLYSYLVDAQMEERIKIGSVVWVPFNNRKVLGVVYQIGEQSKSGLKHIESIIYEKGLSEEALLLVEKVVQRYITSRFDVFRFMLPPALKSELVQKPSVLVHSGSPRTNVTTRNLVLNEIGENSLDIVLNSTLKSPGLRRLIVVPTVRDLLHLKEALKKSGVHGVCEWGSHLTPSQRRNAFSMALDGSASIVIGTRGAIFAPILQLDEIVIVDEFSQNHYELKSPYWNTRDVALLRSDVEGIPIVFVGNSTSLELLRLLEIGWIKEKKRPLFPNRSRRIRVVTAPESYHSTIREGLKAGPVLLSVVDKRYSNVFNCERCRTVAQCECGGRVLIETKGVFTCSICDMRENSWSCKECGGLKIRTFKFGAERIKEDIGKSFPGIPIFLNTADKMVEGSLPQRSIVISTHGVEPYIAGGYGSVVLLGGEDLVNRPFIRAEEETVNRWFKVLSHLKKDGGIYLSLPAQHGISQSIIQQKPLKYLRTESSERAELDLPPHTRLITIRGDVLSIPNLKRKLESQFVGNLTTHISLDGKVLTLKIKHNDAHEVLSALRALQKLRSLKKKELFSIRVDPYEI